MVMVVAVVTVAKAMENRNSLTRGFQIPASAKQLIFGGDEQG